MKQKILICCFVAFLFGIPLLNVVNKDQELSKTERRKLAQFPEFSISTFMSGDFAKQFEEYLLDQFPGREMFRSIQAFADLTLFRMLETNDMYVNHQHLFKKEKVLDEKQVVYAANKLNEAYEKYLKGMNVAYAIIPEKNCFDEQNMIPKRNHEKLVSLMRENLSFKEIEIQSLLSLSDYYFTDPHWKQEKIYPIAYEIAKQLGNEQKMIPYSDYEFKTLAPFYGAYAGQAALPGFSDEIQLAYSSVLKEATVSGLEFEGEKEVYREELFEGMDGYDVYLSGPQAIVELTCENANSDKELIIFRDSFGSSIAPYFAGAYKKITLIDLRYIGVDLLQDEIDFNHQDVLFLYSTSVLNNGMILK